MFLQQIFNKNSASKSKEEKFFLFNMRFNDITSYSWYG